jgi:hypothetical protein
LAVDAAAAAWAARVVPSPVAPSVCRNFLREVFMEEAERGRE